MKLAWIDRSRSLFSSAISRLFATHIAPATLIRIITTAITPAMVDQFAPLFVFSLVAPFPAGCCPAVCFEAAHFFV
jgi:hypothetical protein